MGAVATEYHWDEADGGTLKVNRVQDCEPIIESVKILRDLTPSKEMRHVARIPAVIVEKYCNLAGIHFSEFMRNPDHLQRVLDDPDLRHFRIAPV